LLQAGADVDTVNDDGKSALMLANEEGHTSIVNLLKEAGAKEY
jgi:ankyrin repeat protein